MPNNSAPLIIIGMHRSGTSMLTHLLRELGIFVGKKLDPNHEALFFQNINDWLLQMAGADWAYPSSFQELLTHKFLRRQCTNIIRIWMSTHFCSTYTGIWNFVRYHSIFKLPFHWCWKDPRSTITLPIWLDILPKAKVLYLVRNGVDVANSLMKRSYKIIKRSVQNPLFKKSKSRINVPKWYRGWRTPLYPPSILDSARCLSLRSAFELWEEYMKIADENLEDLPQKQTITVKYEDFLENGVQMLDELCHFIGLPVNSNRITYLNNKYIINSRAYAYKKNPHLNEFYSTIRCHTYMKKYGY